MKTILSTVVLVIAMSLSSGANADARKGTEDKSGTRNGQVIVELSRSAEQAARASGVSNVKGHISCDSAFIRCTCQGDFHCAWLSWGCSATGGVQGMDGDCFFPSSVPSANSALTEFKVLVGTGPVGPMEGCGKMFCNCTGPSTSAGCNKIKDKCMTELLCIGDDCSCLNGD